MDRLLGAIAERRLDADLVRRVMPQPLWPSLGELDTRELVLATRGKAQTARNLMTRCLEAKPDALLSDVVVSMIRSGHTVTALVDEERRLLGYLSLFEILAELLRLSGL